MDTLNYFIKSAPLPVILHDGLSTIEASDEFKKLTSCQNTQKIDLGQCLLNSFKAGKTLDVLIEGLKQKKELHLDISVYKKGSKTNWKVRSFPFAYAEGDGPCLQITWFIDESYQSMRNAYWDLQVHVNIASAEIIRKGAELNNVNIRLQEINEKLELEISERKKVEEELARLKHQYELILSSAAEGIVGLNLQGNHTFVNPAAARMLGYEAKELIGCRSHSTWHHTKPDGSPYPAEECKIYAAYRDGVEYRSSADVFWRKNGTSFPVEYMSMPIYEQERVVGAVLTFTDITERKKAEEALRESENKYRKIFENVQDIFYQADHEGKIIDISPSIERYSGYPRGELIGKPVEEVYFNPEDRIGLLKTIREKGEVIDYELRLKSKDNRLIYASANAHILFDLAGKPIGVEGSLRDITERKRAEEALKENSAFVNTLLNAIPVPVFYKDTEARYIGFNKSFEEFYGQTHQELVGKSVFDLGPRELAEVYHAKDLELLQHSGSQVYESQVKDARGVVRDVVFHKAAFTDPDGHVRGLIGAILDITERKRAEEELQKLAAVVRYSSELINLTTPDGKMVFLNEAGAKMLGISPAEIEKTNIMQIIPDRLKEKVQNELLPALMNNGAWEGDLQYLNLKTGQLTDVHTMSFMIKDAVTGSPLFLANVSLDITEQKELEAALHKAKEEAERANRAKTIFLANMSHEIRTPMNAILGFSQLMQRDPTVTPRQRQQLDIINRSGEHLLALINDILEISKIEAGRVTLNPTAFDLHALLNDLEMMFRLRTDAKNLQFSVERIGEVPRFVLFDEGKLREVLINLLGNAVKFTQKGGIILRVRALHEETKELRLLAEIEDTGPGIAAEDIGRLFHDFEQTQAGREAGTGTGLGLAISRGFVRLMGGDITVSSQVGRGSLFGFNIALKEADPAAVVVKAESRCVTGLQPGQQQYRVLVADDKEDNRELLSQMLGPVGFQIRQVADGEEAVKEFEMWKPSLILMDLRMPVVDGYEAIRRIRASVGGKDARIIAVTASAFEDTRQEVLATGADDFVSKPFRETELLEKIGRLLGAKYIYAEEAVSVAAEPEAFEALTPESLNGLPGELVRQIREATINADLDRMLELIQQVATHNAHAANGLRSLAERFDYQKLLDLLPTGGTTNGTTNES